MMKLIRTLLIVFLVTFNFLQCDRDEGVANNNSNEDYSGVYCLNLQSLEITIIQTGDLVTFTISSDFLTDGTGTISDKSLTLTAFSQDSARFSAVLTFSQDGKSFSGPFKLTDSGGETSFEGTLLGNKEECPQYDIVGKGIPKFVGNDFTQLSKIEQISKFRSGFGHSFTDGFEECRSMKHYFNPYTNHRKNNTVEIYSPVDGIITSVTNDGHGASTGLTNKQLEIKPNDQPAFSFVLFHVDLLSADISIGKNVQSGEKLGYARLYYEDLGEYATSFDIAVWVNSPSGLRLVSYFETLQDVVFANYLLRGVVSREQFIITQTARDSDPLVCSGETFLNGGNLDNWVLLH